MTGSRANEPPAFAEQADVSRGRSNMAELPEREMIRRAQLGDATAFERIYRLHSGRVYALCSRMLRNRTEAEDLTQEAFLAVFSKIRTFRGESAFSTWLHRIAVNLVLMRLRKKTPMQTSPEGIHEQSGDRSELRKEPGGPDLLLAGSIDRVLLGRAIEQLGPCQKLVVELHDIQGYKHKEIAQMMDWSIGNSKSQLHRARRRLRELLEQSQPSGWLLPLGATKTALAAW